MKLTPEQKAFYEYGKALERMNSTKKRLRGIWRSDKGIRYRIGQASIIGPRHKRNVKDAWQKRAACKAWIDVSFRNCENCKHYSVADGKMPCEECVGPYDITPFYWEPRKEDADETDS